MAHGIDISADVNVDVESRRIYTTSAGTPPPEEGEYFGLLFAGENGAEGSPTVIIDAGASDATALPLGARDWTNGAVALDAATTTADAIALINAKVKEVSEQEPAAADGFHLLLGDPAVDGDGSFAGGAVPLEATTPISEGIDRLNEVLGKLVPGQPPAFPNGTLSVINTAGNQARLAAGYTYNGGEVYLAGTAVTRITAAGVSSGTFNDVGPGEAGTIRALLNDVVAAEHILAGAADNGNYAGLVIADQKDFPVATPGFWTSIDISLTLLACDVGLNQVRIDHSGAGASNLVTFLRDDMTSVPALSAGSVVEAAGGPGTVAYSSSVPHYNTDAYLTVGMSIANLAGEAYYGGVDPIQFSGPVISTKTIGYEVCGIDLPIARGTTAPVAIVAQTISVDGSGHTSGKITGIARNVNGVASADLGGPTVLIKRGSAGARIDENAVSGPGVTAVRKGSSGGNRPGDAPVAWHSSEALAAHEAAVVAGVLKHDQTNYAAGYLPAGPDLSAGRSGAQYVNFSFSKAALSAFKIVISGSYAGAWVKLPGVTDDVAIAPNAANGWMDAFAAYDGAGVPGKTGDLAAGCALGAPMNGGSGTFQITFGTESSTNADGNEVLIRLRLNAGQSITALSFTS